MRATYRGLLPVLAMSLCALPGCAGGGALGNVIGGVLGGGEGGGQGQVLVEIQAVDPRQQAIQVRTEQGETGAVLFDQNTVVIYREQQYPVTALERGDVAVLQLQQVDRNRLYTPRVDVRQSVQERTGQSSGAAAAQTTRFAGEVGLIDHDRGSFELRTEQGIYTVILPQNATPAMTERFHGLKAGAAVSVEGRRVEADGIVLARFL